MKKLLKLGNLMAKNSTWKDFALIKLCLCAMGLIIGVLLPSQAKQGALIIAVLIFVATYIPLMCRFFEIVRKESINNN